MSLIQFIIVGASFSFLALYFLFFRSLVRDRLFALLLFTLAVVATLFPDLTTIIANRLGVGRGTDLVFYLFAITTVFVLILLYGKISRLESAQTALIRELAIKAAANPDTKANL